MPREGRRLAALAVALPILAGCFGQTGQEDSDGAERPGAGEFVDGLFHARLTHHLGIVESYAASGSISRLVFPVAETLRIPENVYAYKDGRFLADKEFDVTAAEPFEFLVPPGATSIDVYYDAMRIEVPTPDTGEGLFKGENIVEEFKVLRDQYPSRCNGCPNYLRSQTHFRELFQSYGFPFVDVDPYGANAIQPAFANVVAYRYDKTDLAHPRWLGVGGHYDVTRTREGAIDNTAGTLATLELARVFGQLRTNHNLVFGLWGGEESGLLGSEFFVRSNPNIAAQMSFYVNLDVSGFSWPAPKPASRNEGTPDCSRLPARSPTSEFYCPDPVLVSAGPDGPVAERLLTKARTVQTGTMVGYPDEYFIYEPVGQGQFQGYAGVNAQSDHTSFIGAGVPSYFLFNANTLKSPIHIHTNEDTLENWTKYVLDNYLVDLREPLHLWGDEAVKEAEALAARSFETYLWLAFYTLLMEDLALTPLPIGL